MAFIIPNAVDTTSGNKYVSLDQAEPDSLDFEILGNGNTGVIDGCAVAPTPVQGGSVSVSEGNVLLNGVRYSVAANSFLVLPSPPTYVRFDLIVARLTGSTMQTIALYGNESSTNPSFPKSKSTMPTTTGVNVLSYFNPDTDVILAAIYRYGSNNIVSSHIVDKRRMVQSSLVFRGAVGPTASQGSVGDLYFRTGSLGPAESGVYVKHDASTWVQFGSANVDPGIPVGTVITWVSPVAPNGAVWAECDGSALSRTLYSSLFSILGTTYGNGDGATTFNVPDFRGMYLASMPQAGASFNSPVGNTGNVVSLTTSNIPAHTHPINHGHDQTSTGEGGEHVHSSGVTSAQIALALDSPQSATYVAPKDNTGWGGTNSNPPGFADGYSIDSDFLNSEIGISGLPIGSSQTTSSSDPLTHTHSVAIPVSTNLVSGEAGEVSPVPVNIQPRTYYVKYYIRCS